MRSPFKKKKTKRPRSPIKMPKSNGSKPTIRRRRKRIPFKNSLKRRKVNTIGEEQRKIKNI